MTHDAIIQDVENFLAHHGIQGQKWGVRHGPPYPLGSGTSTGKSLKKDAKPKTSISGKAEGAFKKKVQKKIDQIKKKREAKKQLKEAKAQEKFERKKDNIKKNPTKMYLNRDKFTDDEVNKANKRFDLERNLRNLSIDDIRKGKLYIDALLGYADTAVKAYTLYNKFMSNREEHVNRAQRMQDAIDNAKTLSNKTDEAAQKIHEEKSRQESQQQSKSESSDRPPMREEPKTERWSGDVVDEGRRDLNPSRNRNSEPIDVEWREVREQNRVNDSRHNQKLLTQKDTSSNNRSDNPKVRTEKIDITYWRKDAKERIRNGESIDDVVDDFTQELLRKNEEKLKNRR